MKAKNPYMIKAKIHGCQLITKVRVSSDLVININQCDLLSREYTYGFFKLNKSKKNRLEFSGPAGISLYERLKKPISEYDFFFIIEQIVDVIQKTTRIGLSPGNLVFDFKHIYYNESTRELSFIYLPIATPHEGAEALQFIEQVIYSSQPTEDSENFLSNFIYFIKNLEERDLSAIEDYIQKIDESIVAIIKRGTQVKHGFTEKAPVFKSARGSQFSGDDATDLMFDDDKTDIMRETVGSPLNGHVHRPLTAERTYSTNDEATSLLDDDATELFEDGSNDRTDLLADGGKGQISSYPTLVRVLTEEIIQINKPVFRIGKDLNCVDYAVSDNAAISRSHADIICRDQRYFVFDLRSKNKTYINNRVLPAEQEVEIFDGDVLKLANEEFVFRV